MQRLQRRGRPKICSRNAADGLFRRSRKDCRYPAAMHPPARGRF